MASLKTKPNEKMFQSYAVVLSRDMIQAYKLSASLTTNYEPTIIWKRGGIKDIFDEKLKDDQITSVIDGLLKDAHKEIQKYGEDHESIDPENENWSRHDAAPLYLAYYPKPPGQEETTPSKEALLRIASAVHSSGYGDYRFRIIPHYQRPSDESRSMKGSRSQNYTFDTDEAAKKQMRKDFEPLWEATAVFHEKSTEWLISPYAIIQNRAHDCGIISDPSTKFTVEIPQGAAADQTRDPSTYLETSLKDLKDPKVPKDLKLYISCPEKVYDKPEYNLRYENQLGMGCFPNVVLKRSQGLDYDNYDLQHDVYWGTFSNFEISLNLALYGGYRYVVIIDAGSSGSRVYVYKWFDPGVDATASALPYKVIEVGNIEGKHLVKHSVPDPDAETEDYRKLYCDAFVGNENTCSLVADDGVHSCLQKGISTLADNLEVDDPDTDLDARVEHHLHPLMAYAQYKIIQDSGHRNHAELLVGATGGMRALGNTNEFRQIETSINKAIQKFDFARFNRTNYKTISGKVEGIFGWAAANYDQEKLTVGSSGYIEMGGQTMQIALQCPRAEGCTQKIRIGREFHVYAHCWEDRGADAAWRKHRNGVYNGDHHKRGDILQDKRYDCLPRGVLDDAEPSPPGEHGYTGTGHFIQCVQEIFSLAECYEPTDSPKQAGFLLNPMEQPGRNAARALATWKGASTFFHGVNNLTKLPPYNPIGLMREAADLHTGSYLNYITRQDKTPAKYFCRAVFNALYTIITLHYGFGIRIRTDKNEQTIFDELRASLAPEQRWPADGPFPPTLTALVAACVTRISNQAKSYSVINPAKKPWAEGAAVISAHMRSSNDIRELIRV